MEADDLEREGGASAEPRVEIDQERRLELRDSLGTTVVVVLTSRD